MWIIANSIILILIQSQNCYTEIEPTHTIMINFLHLHHMRNSIIYNSDLYNSNVQMVDGQNDN